MRIFSRVESFRPDPLHPLILGLGNFDGLHLGHQGLIQKMVRDAGRLNARSAVFTFREHPQEILQPDSKPPLLISTEQKLYLLERMNVDLCFLVHFTKKFSQITPGGFVKKILVDRLGVRKVYLGFNARFGHHRQGDAHLMRSLAKQYGFLFAEVRPVSARGALVSSSRIRHLISEGSLDEAASCLGRPVSIFGRVVAGDGRGAKLGFPTANLRLSGEILPPWGVYPVALRTIRLLQKKINGAEEFRSSPQSRWMIGALNYGLRPTFDKNSTAPVAEVFILNFKGNLYGKTLEVVIYPRLRAEKKFQSLAALREQIREDVTLVRKFFQRKSLQRRATTVY